MKLFRKKYRNDSGPKVAVVGTGYLGKFHAEKYYQSPAAQLAAVVDVNEGAARKCSKSFGVQAISDFRELPELGIQCASIASTTSTHFEIGCWLLEHGIDVLIEKPMAVRIEEAEQLIEIARREGRILQVGHIERFNPSFQAVKDVLTQPRFFEVRRIARFTGRGNDVDVVMDLMIHDIDLISFLVGKPLRKVEAVGIPVLTSSFDVANARFTFEGGAVANVTASRAAFKTERTMRAFQHDTYVSADFSKKKIKICTKTGEHGVGGFPKISVKERDIKPADALELEIQSFLKAVENRSEPEVPGEDGLRALRVAAEVQQALNQSWRSLESDLDVSPGIARSVNY